MKMEGFAEEDPGVYRCSVFFSEKKSAMLIRE